MKKNVIFRIAAVVLMCTLVTACFASSTFAKYTSQAEGKATATVAKWDIEVTDVNGIQKLGVDKVDNLAFNFAETWTNLVNAGTGDTVKTNLLAPGTQGSFDVKVTNKSDTAAQYTIKLAYDSTNEVTLPDTFVFSTDPTFEDPTKEITLTSDLQDVATGRLEIGSSTAQDATQTIYWQWKFEKDDAADVADTTVGVNAQSASYNDVVLKVAISVDQID